MRYFYVLFVLVSVTNSYADKIAYCSRNSANYLVRNRFQNCHDNSGKAIDPVLLFSEWDENENDDRFKGAIEASCFKGCYLFEYANNNLKPGVLDANMNIARDCEQSYIKEIEKNDSKLKKVFSRNNCTDTNQYLPDPKKPLDNCHWTVRSSINRVCNYSKAGSSYTLRGGAMCSGSEVKPTLCVGNYICPGGSGKESLSICMTQGMSCENIDFASCNADSSINSVNEKINNFDEVRKILGM